MSHSHTVTLSELNAKKYNSGGLLLTTSTTHNAIVALLPRTSPTKINLMSPGGKIIWDLF